MAENQITVGRRKTSTARALLKPGNGTMTVNGKSANQYFGTELLYQEMLMPLKVTDTLNSYNVAINVRGGGFSGQVGAIKLAIARALIVLNPDYRAQLKPEGLLTRDPRMVERKKYGRPKARKRFQFSKR